MRVCSTQRPSNSSICVAFSYAMMAYDTFPQVVIPANSCVEVTQPDELVRTWDIQNGAGELVAECGLVFIFRCKCRGIHLKQLF